MPLHEFLEIFRERKNLFLAVLIGALLLSLLAYRLQPATYNVSLILSVTRVGKDQTTDYRYDEFYRLQADERFSDTIVRFLKTPQALRDIETRAALTPSDANFFLAHGIYATRLSSNIISVVVKVRSPRSGQSVATALPDMVNLYIDDLNQTAKVPDWFQVIASQPDITDARYSLRTTFLAGLALGLFLAFWSVLIDYFWKGMKEKNEPR